MAVSRSAIWATVTTQLPSLRRCASLCQAVQRLRWLPSTQASVSSTASQSPQSLGKALGILRHAQHAHTKESDEVNGIWISPVATLHVLTTVATARVPGAAEMIVGGGRT